MNHSITDKLIPLTYLSLDPLDRDWKTRLSETDEPFVFLTKNEEVVAYVYLDDLDKKQLTGPAFTTKDLEVHAVPISNVGEWKMEQPVSLPFIFQVLGEHITLIKNETDEWIGYVRREDALVELFRQDNPNLNLLKVMLSSIPMGVFVINEDTKIVNCNESGLKMIKSSYEEVINNKAGVIFNQEHINKVLDSGETMLNQIHITDDMGVLVDYSPILKDGKQVEGMIIIVQDLPMVEEMAMEIEYVKNLNTDLNAILATMYDEILVVNQNGELLRYSENFLADFWGVEDMNELLGKSLLEFEERGIFSPSVTRLVLEKKKKVSVVQQTPDGKNVLAVGNPVLNDDGEVHRIIIASRDITETTKLKTELRETKRLTKNYKEELDKLKNRDAYANKIIYCSNKMEKVMNRTRKLADFNSTVLILGESGVGKELIAKSIHREGNRADQPYLALNCGAITEDLLESELFGYTKGAFTGADSKGKIGYFEQANQGVLFLDEISEIPPRLQVKLLRVLQEKEVTPVGSTQSIPVDVQIIAATNRNLEKMVADGTFREDLFYRINVIPIQVPPLRERPEDVPLLAFHFIQQLNEKYNKKYHLSPEALNLLEVYDWPGNVRELQNLMERLVVTADDDVITADFVNQSLKFGETKQAKPVVTGILPLQEARDHLEEQLIMLAMKKYKTTTKAAAALGISQSAVSRKYQKIMKNKETIEL
ncbi:Transcriptional regulator containing PAS, AAA-type ATPase, and DNA-binding Fis domains [Thalassobacillus cyri]|uniref:HTH-type transcriptional regulatory protein TyrR n=1 Tax=Thalassobacillus cyri TaxID=571932 RepID=A0A1H3ZKT6_9BACI|nr:sigma 54-interacting transcriptional regulator [Thalassobacillus cyri]SEA23884.1 Transcriptional regulator containing PAS, AAA-type ATPase, and DNA-binding Fis domains [Thalassobacillus cyri]